MTVREPEAILTGVEAPVSTRTPVFADDVLRAVLSELKAAAAAGATKRVQFLDNAARGFREFYPWIDHGAARAVVDRFVITQAVALGRRLAAGAAAEAERSRRQSQATKGGLARSRSIAAA